MNYEPLNYNPYHDASIYGFLFSLGFAALVFFIFFNGERDSDFKANLIGATIVAFFAPFIAIFSIMSMTTSYNNSDHLQYNVKQKYNIQGMHSVDRGFTETQTDPQRVEIMSQGKTRFVWLIQNSETSEPTLLDYDSKKPIEDLLRKP